MFDYLSPQAQAAYATATGGLDPHQIRAAMRSVTCGIPLDRLEALHAAALGRDVFSAGPMPRLSCLQEPCEAARAAMVPPNVAAPSACGGAALRLAYRAILGAL